MHQPYNLFLDDERFPLDVLNFLDDKTYQKFTWQIVRTASSFKDAIINNGIPNCISFDNDIQDFSGENGQEITGYKLAEWLVYYCIDNKLKFPQIIKAHSRNIVDQPNIIAIFKNAAKIFPELYNDN